MVKHLYINSILHGLNRVTDIAMHPLTEILKDCRIDNKKEKYEEKILNCFENASLISNLDQGGLLKYINCYITPPVRSAIKNLFLATFKHPTIPAHHILKPSADANDMRLNLSEERISETKLHSPR